MRLRQVQHVGRLCHQAWMRSLCTSQPSNALSNTRTLPKDFTPAFDPQACEKWYDRWEAAGQFKSSRGGGDKYNMLLPPPNVTGKLHIGHALTVSIQDALCRWRRMSGDDVQFIPGTDHAGIATQSRVERLLKDKGIDVSQLSRREKLEHVQKWKDEHGDAIVHQLRQLGVSSDWSRQFFTMDKQCVESVNEAFIDLFKRGLIYRDVRFANWCCRLKTVISNIEVDEEHYDKPTEISVAGYDGKVKVGVMHHVVYPLASGGEVVVATTRPETIPADAALAVHPDDLRYRHLHGSSAFNPLTNKAIPIICDAELVDMEKGTGIVKVTPCHDARDYECGLRHDLPMEVLFDEAGYMVLSDDNVVHRFAARELILESLQHNGFYRGAVTHPMIVQRCSRSGDLVEPVLYPQWFLRMGDFCKMAIKDVETGALQIGSQFHESVWKEWLGKEQDWCVSRQLYWGHRIPAWRLMEGLPASKEASGASEEEEIWVVGRTEAEAKEHAVSAHGCDPDKVRVEQDDDVLDTWFSSSLLPLSQSGWPSKDLSDFYPLSVMETGHDILFFWVAKMYMMCKALHPTGQAPFSRVLLHPLVKDASGAKMSKSKGNVVDPMDLINGTSYDTFVNSEGGTTLSLDSIKESYPDAFPACGADALRLVLARESAISNTQCRLDFNFDISEVTYARKFCVKVWNGVRFAYMLWPADFQPSPLQFNDKSYSILDHWIMNKAARLLANYEAAMEKQALGDAAALLDPYFRDQLCTQYIEFVKVAADIRESMDVLYFAVAIGLQVMHPFMPFITEDLWQRLPHPEDVPKSIYDSRLPSSKDLSVWLSSDIDCTKEIVNTIAHQCKAHVKRYKASEGTLCITDPDRYRAIESCHSMLERYLCLERLHLKNELLTDARGILSFPLDGTCVFYIDGKSVDFSQLRVEYSSNIKRLEGQRDRILSVMARGQYAERAPEEVKAKDQARLDEIMRNLASVEEALSALPQAST